MHFFDKFRKRIHPSHLGMTLVLGVFLSSSCSQVRKQNCLVESSWSVVPYFNNQSTPVGNLSLEMLQVETISLNPEIEMHSFYIKQSGYMDVNVITYCSGDSSISEVIVSTIESLPWDQFISDLTKFTKLLQKSDRRIDPKNLEIALNKLFNLNRLDFSNTHGIEVISQTHLSFLNTSFKNEHSGYPSDVLELNFENASRLEDSLYRIGWNNSSPIELHSGYVNYLIVYESIESENSYLFLALTPYVEKNSGIAIIKAKMKVLQ